MKDNSRGGVRKRRSLAPLAWAALPVFALGFGVLASGVGIDLLLIAGVALCLFTMERTIGDWLAEAIGPPRAAILFTLGLAGLTWCVIDASDSFLAAAENRGYRGVYYRASSASAASLDSSKSSVSALAPSTASPATEVSPVPNAQAGKDQDPNAIKSTGISSQPARKGTVSASRIVFGSEKKAPSPAPTVATLSLSLAKVAPARPTVLQVAVTSPGRPVTEGTIEFIVNGAVVARVPLGSRAVATTPFATYIPGMYEVQAHFSGTIRFEPSSSRVQMLQVSRQ